jgi:hypothetical protein
LSRQFHSEPFSHQSFHLYFSIIAKSLTNVKSFFGVSGAMGLETTTPDEHESREGTRFVLA